MIPNLYNAPVEAALLYQSKATACGKIRVHISYTSFPNIARNSSYGCFRLKRKMLEIQKFT